MLTGKKLTKEDLDNSFPFIKNLAELLVANGLYEIEIKKGDLSIKINSVSASLLTQNNDAAKVQTNHLVPPRENNPKEVSPRENNLSARIIPKSPLETKISDEAVSQKTAPQYDPKDILKSPMVGTAYLSPSPGSDNFVRIGSEVSKGQTVMIVEAMKTMNHISAHKSGIIRAVLIDNEDPVEYNQDLVVIE